MSVILVDPRRPMLIPAEAIGLLTADTAVICTEELPPALAEVLPGSVVHRDEPAERSVLISSNPDHPAVIARITEGERVIAVPEAVGDHLLDAVVIMDRLRADGPWEGEQTHESLLRYLVEETYELVDAVHAGDREQLRAELGDVLLQVLFHARIAAEDIEAGFTIDDVADTLVAKLRDRAEAVLSGQIISAEEQLAQWNERKAAERQRKTGREGSSVLDGVSTAQPALALAGKVIQRLREADFPADLIPAAVTTVTVSADTDGENELRAALSRFIATIRRVETAARGRDGSAVVTEAQWRELWPETEAWS